MPGGRFTGGRPATLSPLNHRHFLYGSASLAIVSVATVIYLLDSPVPQSGSSGNASQTAATDTTNDRASSHSEQRESADAGASQASKGDQHPSQTERVVPEKYSAGPKQTWEKELIALSTRLDVSDQVKIGQLLAKISSLPPDGKVLAMEYATKLIPDEQYVQYRPMLFGLVSSPELRETVLLDALTRGESVRMPTLVEMLRQPSHPSQDEVREILVAYLDADYGKDVNGWDAAVKKFLAENPDL
jgi:hypothetical protein